MGNILILVWDVHIFTFLFILSDKVLMIQTKTHDMLKVVPPIEHIPQKNAKIRKKICSYVGPSKKSILGFKSAEFKPAFIMCSDHSLNVFLPDI